MHKPHWTEEKTAPVTEGSPVLYCWKEYGISLRIIQFGDQKIIQAKRAGKWKPCRILGDNEYNACFKDLAEDWQVGRPTDWDVEG